MYNSSTSIIGVARLNSYAAGGFYSVRVPAGAIINVLPVQFTPATD